MSENEPDKTPRELFVRELVPAARGAPHPRCAPRHAQVTTMMVGEETGTETHR